MSLGNSFSSKHMFNSASEIDSESSISEKADDDDLNNSIISNFSSLNINSNVNEKSDKLNSSINDTFVESSIDDNDFIQDSSSREKPENYDFIDSKTTKKNSFSFENDFVDDNDNDFRDDLTDETKDSNYINLISMDQIEKEVDELINKDYPPNPSNQDKPQFRVTFGPEVHEMAYRNYKMNQIRKQQEILEYQKMLREYAEEEEEEAEFERFNDQEYINDFDEKLSNEEQLQNNENQSIIPECDSQTTKEPNNEEDYNENDSSIISDKDHLEINSDSMNLDVKNYDRNEKDTSNEEAENEVQPPSIEEDYEDPVTSDKSEMQIDETKPELEKGSEAIPFIPPLDLSQFNSSKLISASQTMNKSNKIISHYNKPKRPVSSCGRIPECVIPAKNKTHSKSHQSKSSLSSSPPNKSSPLKSSPPIKLDSINQFENQNTSPNNKSPMSLLEQVQKKSTEMKAEELRNNGFMITFLHSPHIANKQSLHASQKPTKTENKDFTSLLLGTTTNSEVTSPEQPLESSPKSNENGYLKEEEEVNEKEKETKKYTDEELKKAVDDMLDHKILPPTEMHVSIQVYLKNNIYKNIIDQDYDAAERLKSAQDMLSNGNSQIETKNERKMIVQSIEARIESTKDKLHEMKQQWTIKMQRFEEEIQTKTDELELKQKEEITKFEETWNGGEILSQFNKPSAQLLEIRKMQKTKALSSDFAGARELKKRGDILEKEETRRAERKAMASMKNSYNQLISKQQRELEYAKQNWQRQRNLIENERDTEIHSIELTLKQLITKLNEIKARQKTNSIPRNLVLSNSSKINNNNSSLSENKKKSKNKREIKTPATTTPRTRKQVAKFRTEPRQEKLSLNGLNVHQYVKSNSKSNSKVALSHVIREKSDF